MMRYAICQHWRVKKQVSNKMRGCREEKVSPTFSGTECLAWGESEQLQRDGIVFEIKKEASKT